MVGRAHHIGHELTTALLVTLLAIVLGVYARTAIGDPFGQNAAEPTPIAQACCGSSLRSAPVTGVVAAGRRGRGIAGTFYVSDR